MKPEEVTFEYHHGPDGKCLKCGHWISEHLQDILNDPTRLACPIDGVDFDAVYKGETTR